MDVDDGLGIKKTLISPPTSPDPESLLPPQALSTSASAAESATTFIDFPLDTSLPFDKGCNP